MKNAFLFRKLAIVAVGAVAAALISAHSAHADTQGAIAVDASQQTVNQEVSKSDRAAAQATSNGDVGGVSDTNWARGSRSNQSRSSREVVVSDYSVPVYKARQ